MTSQRQSIKSKKKTDRLASASLKKEKSQPEPLSTTYQNISDLPLVNFISCSVDGDLNQLILSGTPTEKELRFAWSIILEQYQTAIGDTDHRLFLSAYRNVHLIDLHIKGIEICIAQLRIAPTPYFIDQLKQLDRPMIRVNLNWDDQKSYHDALDKCSKRTNGLKTDLEIKKITVENLVKAKGGEQAKNKMDRQSYISNLITLSGQGFPIQAKDITTFEYFERLRRHTALVEAQNRKYNK